MIIGHQKQKEIFKRMEETGEIPHALLLSGPAGLGKKEIALEFISSLLEPQAELSSHPDFNLITPDSGNIKIEQIRNLNWKLSLKPIQSSLTGALMDRAHLMTREAQNCFLKSLEEPKADSILILISEHPRFLLPTILSRCEEIKFYPVDNQEIRKYLEEKDVTSERVDQIIKFSLGRPGRAMELLENPELLEKKNQEIEKVREISQASYSTRFEYVKKIAEQEDLMETLSLWLFYFRDLLISEKKEKKLLKIKNIIQSIQKTIYLISTTNTNKRLALEVLVLKL